MTADPAERVSLAAWQGGFNIAGAVGGMAVAGMLIEAHGYRTMALAFAPAILLCAWAPLLVPTPLAQASPCRMPLLRSIRATLRNPLFIPYVTSQVLFWIALRIVLAAGPKIIEVRARVRETEQGLVMASALVAAALLLPAMKGLAERFGKRQVLIGAMVHFGVVMIPLALVGMLPGPLNPLAQAFTVMVLASPAIAALFTLPNAMVADIVDHEEGLSGERREAMYFGVQGLLVKTGLGLGIGVAAVLLDRLGETATRQGGFVACAVAAMILSWLAALALTRYRGD
jgi:GPH family glycoside/pentoside/hexuronide:cation symporter